MTFLFIFWWLTLSYKRTFIFTKRLKITWKRVIIFFKIATSKYCDAVNIIGIPKVSDKSPLPLSS